MSVMSRVEIHHSVVYDFIASMFRINCNEELLKSSEVVKERIKYNENIIQWIKDKRKLIPDNIQHLMNVFFNYETFYGMCLVPFISASKCTDVESFIHYIEEQPAAMMLKEFLSTGSISENIKIDMDFVNRLIKDEKEAVLFIQNNISIPQAQKWGLLEFILKPEKMKEDLVTLFKWYYSNIFKNEINNIEPIIEECELNLKDKLNHYGEEYLKTITAIDYRKDTKKRRIVLALSYYYEAFVLFAGLDEENTDMYMIGYRYPELFANREHALLSGAYVFKVLGDEVRLNIIKLISKRPWYGYELADKLKLSNSNIFHHLAMLEQTGFTNVERVDNKLYYSVDMDELTKVVLDILQKIKE